MKDRPLTGDEPEQCFCGRLEVAVRTVLSPCATNRAENQDNYLVVDARGCARYLRDERPVQRQLDGWPRGHLRLAVLDGMGGHVNGRAAAEKTVQGVLRIPPATTLAELSPPLERLHDELHAQMHRPGEYPGCTLTLLEIPAQGPALLFHVGDSRLYEIDARQVRFLTVDHVPATRFAMLARMPEQDWVQHVHNESRPIISQAFVLGNSLGGDTLFEDELRDDLFELHDGNLPAFLHGLGDRRELTLEPGRVYLLGSDGLWHLPGPQRFVARWPRILGRPEQTLQVVLDELFDELAAVAAAETDLSGDNATAVAFRVLV